MAPLELCSEQPAQPFALIQLTLSLAYIENSPFHKKNKCFKNTLNQKLEVYISKQFTTRLLQVDHLKSNKYHMWLRFDKMLYADYETKKSGYDYETNNDNSHYL